MEVFVLFGIFLLWLLPAYLCGRIAAQKGYSYSLFVMLGLVFGLIMLVIVCVMPRREASQITPPA